MIETVEDMVDVFSKSTAKLQERIAELEQENERLREAAESLLDSVRPRFDLQHNKLVPDFSLDKLREALEENENGDKT